MREIYRALAGALSVFAVVSQCYLTLHDRSGAALATEAIRFFSFFTIQTNILVAAAYVVPLVAPHSAAARFLLRPSVRTALVGYIIVVGVVFYVLLSDLGAPSGARLFFERVLHYVIPPLFVLDWLFFVPKGETHWRVGLDALGFPAAYAAWTLAHGAVSGWYPYPFLDVADLGYAQALINIAGLVLAFLALELALVVIDRILWLLGRPAAADPPPT